MDVWGRNHICRPNMANTEAYVANNLANTSGVEKQRSRLAHNQETAGAAPASATTYEYRDKEKRRAYMRELMRERRRKTKAP